MALILEANYSKKIGLPVYSSHQFSITLKTEITDPAQVQAESSRLYSLLQSAVDEALQQVGWLPEKENGAVNPSRSIANGNGNGNGNGHANGHGNNHSNGHGPVHNHSSGERWNCSDKQRDLIQKIVQENNLDKNGVEELAMDRFGKGVRDLNKLEASGLIDELFERHGGNNGNQRRGNTNRRYTPSR